MRSAIESIGGIAERKSTVLQQLDCVAYTIHQCVVSWVSSFAR